MTERVDRCFGCVDHGGKWGSREGGGDAAEGVARCQEGEQCDENRENSRGWR